MTAAAPIFQIIGDSLGYISHLRSGFTTYTNGNALLSRGVNLCVLSFMQDRLNDPLTEIPQCYRTLADQIVAAIDRISSPYWTISSFGVNEETRQMTYLYLCVIYDVVEIINPSLSGFDALLDINNFFYTYVQSETRPHFVEMWNEALRNEQTFQNSSINNIKDFQQMYLALTRYFIVNTLQDFGGDFSDNVQRAMRETVEKMDRLLNALNHLGPFGARGNMIIRRRNT